MICPKCNNKNIDGSTFCVKCGVNLKELAVAAPEQNIQVENQNMNAGETVINEQNTINNVEQPVVQNMAQANQTVVTHQVNQTPIVANKPFNYIMYVVAILLKPFQSFKEESSKLETTKTSILFAVLMAAFMTIVNLFKTMFNSVRVVSLWSDKTEWVWENLKELKYGSLIFKNFLIYIGIIFAIAVVFYIASLIARKELKFTKALAISVTSVIPAVLGLMILAPLCSLIWIHLGTAVSVASGVYSIVILYELVNSEINLEGDNKVYFNLICFFILAFAGYYAFVNLFSASVTSSIGDFMELFN